MEIVKLRAYADGIVAHGKVESFSQKVHLDLLQRASLLSGVLIFLALVLGILRTKVLAFATKLANDRRTFKKDIARDVRKLNKYSSRDHKKVAYGILALGIGLRIFFLFEPITYDEAFTYVHYVSKPFSILLSDHTDPNNHIFHNLLTKCFTSIFGPGVIPLRITAFLFGTLFMVLVYLFTRVMFNRYIAITTLALVASAGGFIEYSALARGYSITWVCFAIGLLLGRYFLKKNNLYALVLLGLVNAVGMWAVPTMIYASLSIYIWIVIGVVLNYKRRLNQRLFRIVMSLAVTVATTAFLYLPVILAYGAGQLFSHSTMNDTTWGGPMEHGTEQLYSVWAYINQTSLIWISLILILSSLFALIISSKFRILIVGVIAAIILIVSIQTVIDPARIWNFALVYVYIGGGIGIFYFLKFLQTRVFRKLGKRLRTSASGYIIILGCGYLSFIGISDRIYRMHESDALGSYFNSVLESDDRVFVTFPIEAQVEYEFLKWDIDMSHLYIAPKHGSNVYVLVNTTHDQTLEEVMGKFSEPENFEEATLIEEKGNTSIYKTTLR